MCPKKTVANDPKQTPLRANDEENSIGLSPQKLALRTSRKAQANGKGASKRKLFEGSEENQEANKENKDPNIESGQQAIAKKQKTRKPNPDALNWKNTRPSNTINIHKDTHSFNIFKALIDDIKETKFVTADGKEVTKPLVVSYGIKLEALESKLDADELQQFHNVLAINTFKHTFFNGANFSPIKKYFFSEPSSTNNNNNAANIKSPIKAVTGSGVTLYKLDDGFTQHDAVVIFVSDAQYANSNINLVKQIKDYLADATNKEKFESSDAFKAVKNPSEKANSLTITPESLLKVEREKRDNKALHNTTRITSQNAAVAKSKKDTKAASADDYLQFKHFLDTARTVQDHEMKGQWLHLIAHHFLGNESQDEANLVAGTDLANATMLITSESLVGFFKKMYDKFELDVKACTISKTHIGEEIEYLIKTPDFDVTFHFNPLYAKKPHIAIKYAHHLVFETLAEFMQAKKDTPITIKPEDEKFLQDKLNERPRPGLPKDFFFIKAPKPEHIEKNKVQDCDDNNNENNAKRFGSSKK